ncbi:hypothetical protein NE865_13878 [Phthorimaea operculella]|nr:hypothetical protein NE865_13878 [Phthorimaea operculella]
MQWNRLLYVTALLVLLLANCRDVSSQDTPFELPVQLVGFPFIVLSVRLTNFLKKLSYSVSPATYRARNRRELTLEQSGEPFDAQEVEKYIAGFEPATFSNCTYCRRCHYQLGYRGSILVCELNPAKRDGAAGSSVNQKNIANDKMSHSAGGRKWASDVSVSRNRQYKRSPDQAKEYYLLSVFLGDIVGSPQLCHQLGKRRSCDSLDLGDS